MQYQLITLIKLLIAKVRCSFYSTGESLSLLVERTAPAIGNVTVEWRIEGPRVSMTFTDTLGTLFFSEVIKKNMLFDQIM